MVCKSCKDNIEEAVDILDDVRSRLLYLIGTNGLTNIDISEELRELYGDIDVIQEYVQEARRQAMK